MEQIDLASERGLGCDVRLGCGPNDWDVARHARQKFPNLPIAYVTGDSASEWTTGACRKALCCKKPFASAELVTALANLLVTRNSAPPAA